MKRYVRPKNLPLLVVILGLLGMVLRIWTRGEGPDKLGLYQPQPLAWALLVIVMVLAVGLILVVVRGLKNPGGYHDHFPASVTGAAGCGIAAVALVLVAFRATGEPAFLYALLSTGLGIAAAVGMVIAAVSRYYGNQNAFWGLLLSCVFLALRTFDCCRGWNNEPQIGVFLPELLALISIMLAFFHLTAVAAGLPNRRNSVFWGFTALFFCFVAMPGSEDWLFYGAMVLFLMTNHCSLLPIPRAPAVVEEQPVEEENTEQ